MVHTPSSDVSSVWKRQNELRGLPGSFTCATTPASTDKSHNAHAAGLHAQCVCMAQSCWW